MRPSSNIPFDRQAALANLGIAASVALLIWLAWWIWQDAPPPLARQRKLAEVTASWHCVNNHVYEGPGAYGRQLCRECGAEAYIAVRYRCWEHGEIEAKLRHERGPDGELILAGICLEGGEWIAYPRSPACPHCGRRLGQVGTHLFPQPK